MPWKYKDAPKHTKQATSKSAKTKWARIANAVLSETGDEGKAIRIANASVRRKK